VLLLVPTAREAKALFDGGKGPHCEDPEGFEIGGRPVRAALCGFGPAAAGALAALALARERPRRCVLVGVAGSYDLERLPVGSLFRATWTAFADLGAGRPGAARPASALGFEQAPPASGRPAVGDVLELGPAPDDSPSLPAGGLITVARSSGSPEEARERAAGLPTALRERALGEDMEGFAVALAGARLGVPTAIVRAASNGAGDGDRSRWDLAGALAALRAWLLSTPL
jgi:futalosine hydrolase